MIDIGSPGLFPLDEVTGKRASASRIAVAPSAGTLIGLADFADGNTTPASIYAGATWFSGAYSGGAISVVNGHYRAEYPIPSGAVYTVLNFIIEPLQLYEFYVTFRARFTNPHAVKFCKVHGVEVGTNYSNTTYQVGSGGVITQISFGDGTSPSNDAQQYIGLNGANPEDIGVSFGTAVVLTPQSAPFDGFDDEDWHNIKIHHKFNSVVDGVAINDGEYYLEIDGDVYVNATGLINRHVDSEPIEYIAFGDYAQDNDYSFTLDFDSIRFGVGGYA